MSADEQTGAPELPTPPDYDSQKKQLEIEKLNKEIKQLDLELKRKWYRKPQWIAALSPFVLALVTFAIAFFSGFLQNQSTLNKIQEENFVRRKQSIDDSISKLQQFSDSLLNNVLMLTSEKNTLDTLIKKINLTKDTLFMKLKSKDKGLAYISEKYVEAQNEILRLKESSNMARRTISDSAKKSDDSLERIRRIMEKKMFQELKRVDSLNKRIDELSSLLIGEKL